MTQELDAATESESVSRQDNEQEAENGEAVEHLLPNTTIVTHCIYKNDPQRLIKCFEDDTDPYKEEIAELINERDDDGKSPLDIAASLGRLEITKELLQRGADINNFTPKGYSCLHYAAAWGRLPVLKVHIENGGNLQQKNAHEERPRETAMRYSQVECVDFLDWAEAKALLQETIRHTLETFNDADKSVAGGISKEEKTITLDTCKEKQEWLDNTTDATTQDFIANRTALLEIVTPVLQKLSEPHLNPSSKIQSMRKNSKSPERQEKREVKDKDKVSPQQ